MPNDFLKKEPTKNEKMLYQMLMSQQQMEQSLWATSAHMVALGILTKIDPREVAKILVSGEARIKEYSQNVNEEVKKLEAEKKNNQPKADESK
ncbi:MAG: hypothetical protein COT92_01945 [Candidatus Doudnabacteria bacterium CG10_big_fil_rev_8_21_14_0_10_42_18]|uniref:Uncharacterized protein n=1 Tax=Candidatus Doudnabacteria bacterium CG10_big_fil_rev_8_21_14_0_10_42_18 TaxID=1974552 RepID=A0A2H0VB10_9BACT|nr:MAG: hypothetical protein COT92_01945 [Candidatus Doudnabacteria bacterium CG10_big_fil_rev_8_21_14_0_10_42_18]